MLTPVLAMVRKDLRLFFSDRRAVIISFAVPIAIASFFGAIFTGGAGSNEPARIPVAIVDQDGTAISKAIVAGAQADKNLKVTTPSADETRDTVRRGTMSVGVIIPPGFGNAAGKAFFRGTDKPKLSLLYDPSRSVELAMVRGIMTEHIMQAVGKEMFTGAQGRQLVDQTLSEIDQLGMADDQKRLLRDMLGSVRKFYDESKPSGAAAAGPGMSMPYDVSEEAVTARANMAYNGYAHSFAGMGIQFLLFAAANLGIEILLERQRGLWKRLRSAPISRFSLLLGKGLSGALICLTTLWVSFGFAMIVFGVRIQGSVLGFVAVSVACALMASAFGLLIAALGNTPAAARGVTTFVVLIMVMLGGAWVPTFIFPVWLQQLTLVVPTRWAVDGLDAMTWRGIGLAGAVVPTLVQLGFAALFAGVALSRFRWEEA